MPIHACYAEFADRTPHYVLTRTVKEFDWPVARPVSTGFINAGLLDELRLTVHPLLVGQGTSLFDGVRSDRRFEVADSQPLGDGSIRLVYRAVR